MVAKEAILQEEEFLGLMLIGIQNGILVLKFMTDIGYVNSKYHLTQ